MPLDMCAIWTAFYDIDICAHVRCVSSDSVKIQIVQHLQPWIYGILAVDP